MFNKKPKKRFPDDVWIVVLSFVALPKDILAIAKLSKATRQNLCSNPYFLRYLCIARYYDNTEKNQLKKKDKEGSYVSKPYAQSIRRSQMMSKRYELDNPSLGNTCTVLDTKDKLVNYQFNEDGVDWNIMQTRIAESFQEWKNNDSARRLLVCSITPYNNQHCVVNKLLRQYDNKDPYNQALPAVRQVLKLETQETTVLFNMICTPYHFAKEIDGANRVDGIIYVIDPLTFERDYKLVYRHFHDVCGEFHYSPMSCWVVVADAENIEAGPGNVMDPAAFVVISPNLSAISASVSNVLRLEALHTCMWYMYASIALTDTATASMKESFEKWVERANILRFQQVRELDDGETELYEVKYEKKTCNQS
jgi:hypothetical protein